MTQFYGLVKRLCKINTKSQPVRGIVTPDGVHLDEDKVEELIANNYQALMGEPLFTRSDEEN
jgi:hypothetical protein